MNCDETLITVNHGQARTLRFTSPGVRKSFSKKYANLNTVGAYIPFVSADGVLVMDVVVLKAKAGEALTFNVPYGPEKQRKTVL